MGLLVSEGGWGVARCLRHLLLVLDSSLLKNAIQLWSPFQSNTNKIEH